MKHNDLFNNFIKLRLAIENGETKEALNHLDKIEEMLSVKPNYKELAKKVDELVGKAKK